MDLHRIRYRGDKADVELLFKEYNLEGIISASEDRQKLEESNFRNKLLKDGAFLLSKPISPRIFNIVTETKQKALLPQPWKNWKIWRYSLFSDTSSDIFCSSITA